MSEFEQFRCMISSEDSKEEGPAFCAYPKCWLEDCPHKQARDRLAEADTFRNYLIALGHLNEDAFSCAYEQNCKNCRRPYLVAGEEVERDWATCLGYNVKLAAEKAEASLRGEAEEN